MSKLLQTTSALLERLRSLQPLKKEDQQRLDKKFRLEFSYNSNHLEGNTLTYSETELLLLFGDAPGNHTKRELDEMEAHDVAWRLVEEWAYDKEHQLSERDIKNLNEIILVKPFWKDAQTPDGHTTRRLIKVGSYKEHPNSVRLQNGELFHYAAPGDVPIEMGDLITWYRSEEAQELHPIARAAMLHYRFVCIHPFDDGNGRVSRLLMNYALLKGGYPPVVIKTEAKADYLRALHRADVGELEAFVDYVAEQSIWSLQLSLKAATGESIDEPGDFEKRLARLKKKTGAPEEIGMKYNQEALEITLGHLESIFNSWEKAMKMADSIIRSRRFWLSIENGAFNSDNNIIELLQSFVNSGVRFCLAKGIGFPPKNLCFDSFLSTDNGDFNVGRILIDFHENFYELTINSAVKKRFFYGSDYPIPENEQTEIVENLKSHLITSLENNLSPE